MDDVQRRSLLRSLRIGPGSATFDIDWGKATTGSVTLTTERGGQQWSLDRFTQPITVRTEEGWSFEEQPLEVTVVLYRGRKLISAERTWRSARS